MSKGLKTTAALGSMMIGILAMNAGANAQTAGEYGNATGKPIVEWKQGNQDPVVVETTRKDPEPYSEVVQGKNRPTSGSGSIAPKNGVRSGN